MEYYQLKNKLLIISLLIMNFSYSQVYQVEDIDSCTLLSNRKNISHFTQLVDNDSSSFLQILFIQFDNPKFSNAESYYFKIDSANRYYKYVFTMNKIKSSISDSISNTKYFSFCDMVKNMQKSVLQNSVSYEIQTPSYFVIKCNNKSTKVFFLNTNIELAVEKIKELELIKMSLNFIKHEFNVKIHKINDG